MISLAIIFITTAVIPNMLIYIFQFSFNTAVVAAAISAITLIFLKLIQENQELKIKSKRKHEVVLSKNYHEVSIYAINGRRWADLVSKSDTFHADKCTILIRKCTKGLCDETRYRQETDESIEIWKQMQKRGKINQLEIYEYLHLSDHYFAVFDKEVLITGLNNFSTNDSTGQNGDHDSQFLFSSDSPKDSDIIEKYYQHFLNYVRHYKSHKLYDSTENNE